MFPRHLLAALACGASLLALAISADAATEAIHGNVLMQADQVDYDTNAEVVSAHGHVEMDNQGRMLLADEVTYDQKTDTVTASGHVSLMDEKGNVAFSNHVVLKDQMRDGVLDSFGALIGKSGRMAAAQAERIGGRFTIATHAAYTPCKICAKTDRTPVWQVRAYRVVYDQLNHKIIFRDAVFELMGVPILYTPYLSQPDPTVKHASGILTPSLGSATTIGYFARVPVYVALSDSQDMTLAPLISTTGGVQLETEYRQRWNEGGMWLQASAADNPNGGISGEQTQLYAHIFGSGRTPIDSTWRTGFDVQYSSNDTYLKRYDISQLDRLLSDAFIDGESGRSRFDITGYYFEGLRPTDSADQFPFVLPLMQYTYIPERAIAGGQFRFDVNSAVVSRDLGVDSQRLTAEVNWREPFVTGDGQLFTLIADARGDLYHTENNSLAVAPNVPLKSRFVERGVPYMELDWSWPFVKSLAEGRAFVIEPITQFILQPYGGNPKGLPNEDTAAFELDENNVFSANQLPGYDLVESGPRANVGFRAEALFPSGSVETVWGETFRLKPDPIFGVGSGETGTATDIVGSVSAKFLPYIDVTDRIDIDKDDGTITRHEVYLTGIYGRSTLVVSYVQLPQEAVAVGLGPREEVNAQANLNLYENWQLFGAIRRDLIAGQMLDTELGFGYEDECLGWSLAYHRRYTSVGDLPPSTSIVFRFNLKTGDQAIQPFDLFPRDVFDHP